MLDSNTKNASGEGTQLVINRKSPSTKSTTIKSYSKITPKKSYVKLETIFRPIGMAKIRSNLIRKF